jgi:hypothetical protein
MTDDEKIAMLASLVRLQDTLRDVREVFLKSAAWCRAAGAPGVALSALLVGESIGAYSKELCRFVETGLDT